MPSLSRVFEADWLLVQTRKGTVGARVPYEPWNIDLKELDPMQIPQPSAHNSSSATHKPKVDSITDFTLGLGGDMADLASILGVDEEEDPEPYGIPLHE